MKRLICTLYVVRYEKHKEVLKWTYIYIQNQKMPVDMGLG